MMKAEKVLRILTYAVVSAISVLITVILFSLPKFTKALDVIPENREMYIGETNISEYTIYYSGIKAKPGAKRVHDLIYGLTGCDLPVKRGYEKGNAIDVVVTDAGLEISVSDGAVSISAGSQEDVVKAANVFANTYMGYAFAGESREHILDDFSSARIPENVIAYSAANSWMPEREPIICLWKTNIARGQYYNTDAALTSEIMTYSNDQLYEYIKLMKYCGFTGIQITDMCSTWAVYGGYEFVHDRLRFMADAAHSLNMNVTLWVWGAEFTGYGWSDPTVVYHDNCGDKAYSCPDAVSSFDKYYSIYAELADCSDRVIGHFDDPAQIHDTDEIGFFSVMLREKMREVNPDINFGVSDYTDKFDKYIIAEYLGDDFTLYGRPKTYKDIDNVPFRNVAANLGIDLGIWSWNLVEMEIDQMAEMDVNCNIIKDVYLRTRHEDGAYKATYWSEMDSYHIANIFSLYTAGQLLINPEQDQNALLFDISRAMVGDKYAQALFEILSIIQDARSGESFEQFRIGSDEYLRTSDLYPSKDILARCEEYYPVLEEMIGAYIVNEAVPLPVSVTDLLKIVRSHLKQIMEFARFRVNFDEVKSLYYETDEPDEVLISEELARISTSIPNYDCLIGTWGQPEARAQYILLEQFCNEAKIEMPRDPVYDYFRRQYMFEEMIALQKNSAKKLMFPEYGGIFWDFAYGKEASISIVEELIEDGLLIRNDDGTVFLTNWETYVFIGTGASEQK